MRAASSRVGAGRRDFPDGRCIRTTRRSSAAFRRCSPRASSCIPFMGQPPDLSKPMRGLSVCAALRVRAAGECQEPVHLAGRWRRAHRVRLHPSAARQLCICSEQALGRNRCGPHRRGVYRCGGRGASARDTPATPRPVLDYDHARLPAIYACRFPRDRAISKPISRLRAGFWSNARSAQFAPSMALT